MKNPIQIIYNASKKVLSSKMYLLAFALITTLFFTVLVLLPVFTIPGNSIIFQLDIFTFGDYVLILLLSFLMGLMFSMQFYSHMINKSMISAGKGVVGGFSSIVAGIFGTASCSSCIAALFGFIGVGAIFSLLEYQKYIVGISLAIVLLSVYFTSSGIERSCGRCEQNA